MDLGRGLLRAWAVLSIAWVAFAAIIIVDVPCRLGTDLWGDQWWCELTDTLVYPAWVYSMDALKMLGPPLGVLLAGYALAWVVRGFQR